MATQVMIASSSGIDNDVNVGALRARQLLGAELNDLDHLQN